MFGTISSGETSTEQIRVVRPVLLQTLAFPVSVSTCPQSPIVFRCRCLPQLRAILGVSDAPFHIAVCLRRSVASEKESPGRAALQEHEEFAARNEVCEREHREMRSAASA